jgi:hypothetical protein
VLKEALPLLSATVAKAVVPSLKVTEPVGVPDVEGFTVAVKVTELLNGAGFSEDVTVVDVAALLTTKVRAADVLPVKFALPVYVAVSECVPTASFEVAIFARPRATAIVSMTVAPSLNVT